MDQTTKGNGSLEMGGHSLNTGLNYIGSQQLGSVYPRWITEIGHLVETVVVLPQLKIPAPIFAVGFGVSHWTEYITKAPITKGNFVFKALFYMTLFMWKDYWMPMRGCVFVWDYDTPVPIGRLGIGVAPKDLRRGLTKRVIPHTNYTLVSRP